MLLVLAFAWYKVIWVLLGIVSILLVVTVLIQDSKGGGLSSAFGGGGGESLLGAHSQKELVKGTVFLVVMFFALSILGGVLSMQEFAPSVIKGDDPTFGPGGDGEGSAGAGAGPTEESGTGGDTDKPK